MIRSTPCRGGALGGSPPPNAGVVSTAAERLQGSSTTTRTAKGRAPSRLRWRVVNRDARSGAGGQVRGERF